MERTMDQVLHRPGFAARLRRFWDTVARAADAIERSPMEDIYDRLERLEREMAELKETHGYPR
jgi:hypothetical protein